MEKTKDILSEEFNKLFEMLDADQLNKCEIVSKKVDKFKTNEYSTIEYNYINFSMKFFNGIIWAIDVSAHDIKIGRWANRSFSYEEPEYNLPRLTSKIITTIHYIADQLEKTEQRELKRIENQKEEERRAKERKIEFIKEKYKD